MFNLLSSVGGIDSSRFQKPQSMKDQRVGQVFPSDKSQELVSGESIKASNGLHPTSKVNQEGIRLKAASPSGAYTTPKSTPRVPSGDTNSQLDALLMGSFFNKEMRCVYLS